MYEKGVKPHRSYLKGLLVAALLVVMVLVVAAVLLRQAYYKNLQPVSASQRSVLVDIPKNSSVSEIAVILRDKGLIKSTWAFEWYIRNAELGSKLQAGSYSIRPNQGVVQIVDVMTQGQTAKNLVTILPGQRLDQVRRALIESGFAAAVVDQALDPAQYADHPALVDKPAGASLEGYLYPDSYQKDSSTTARQIVTASLDQMQKHLTPQVRNGFVQQGLTVHQGIILASIVEQEVSNNSDRPVVAQIFIKRLRQGIKLQSDITVFYGAIAAGQKPSLAYDSPYNTFNNPGLPPGPVSNVSASSLQAVSAPAATDYLYFVAGDDGKTYFSNTLQEHEALTAEHCKKLCQ
jgi:UPF0755 protein